MKYRSRLDIINSILEAAKEGNGGILKSKMMYKTVVRHDHLQEFLMLLVENDLLDYDSTMHKFKTTEKGMKFLQTYNELTEILKK